MLENGRMARQWRALRGRKSEGARSVRSLSRQAAGLANGNRACGDRLVPAHRLGAEHPTCRSGASFHVHRECCYTLMNEVTTSLNVRIATRNVGFPGKRFTYSSVTRTRHE
jgi:hypothetical protein